MKTQEPILGPGCPKCGGRLIMRQGKVGWFWGCTNYPRCTYSKKADADTIQWIKRGHYE